MVKMPPLLQQLYAAYDRSIYCQRIWVMDLDWYKRIRREFPMADSEPDEAKWIPAPGDRLMGRPVVVRDGGGEPHIEWMTREEIGL